jgi:hypothetical protein
VYAVFAGCALSFGWHDELWRFQGAAGVGKAAVWSAYLLFLGYSVYCSTRENIFKSLGEVGRLHWGRQVGIDLYLGLLLVLSVIYLHEGSLLALALWFVPMVLFANLAALLYVAIHFESLVARFIA